MLKARHDRLIVKHYTPEKIVEGSIIFSDFQEENTNTYEVLNTGPGTLDPFTKQFIPTQYQVGDKIYVKHAFVSNIKIGDEEYGSVRDQEVLGYIEN